jgi:hypothetical protein
MADITANPAYTGSPAAGVESRFSGVSWGAIVAGGIAAAAMAIILMTLGAGLGLMTVSPWPDQGASAKTVGIGIIVWSIIIEIAAFGLGGYLAGRLRTKWANLHGDEVYFRDTAHGFVTWALGTLISIALVTVAAGSAARTTAEVGASAVGGAGAAVAAAGPSLMGSDGTAGPMGGPRRGNPMDYYVDLLFRPAGPAPAAGATGTTQTPAAPTTLPAPAPTGDVNADRAQILHIAAASFKDGTFTLSPEDKAYIGQIIAQRTGLSQADAEKRVDDTVAKAKAAVDDAANKAKEAADVARKAAAGLAMWSFIAMLIGAFVASYAATLGGRHRDL